MAWTIDQLVSGGMQRNQTDACLKERYWRLTRLWRSVMLHCADWMAGSSLLMLLWTPSQHFVHLLSPVVRETRDLVQYPYHISVCDHQDIWRNYAWERHQMYRLQNLYTTDVKKVIPMSSFRSVGSAVVTEGCNLYNDHHPLWSTRGECYKSSLPISLW